MARPFGRRAACSPAAFVAEESLREASDAYIKGQAHEGSRLTRDHWNDGGYSGWVDGSLCVDCAESGRYRTGRRIVQVTNGASRMPRPPRRRNAFVAAA